MAVERQRAKDQQDRAEAERLSLTNEHRDRMKGNTEEFNGQVKRIEDADIRDAQEHKGWKIMAYYNFDHEFTITNLVSSTSI